MREGRAGGLTGRALTRPLVWTVLGSTSILALNLCTGVMTARLLEPDGRGEVGAIAAWAITVSLLAALGFRDAMTYVRSKRMFGDAEILSTTLVSIAVLGGIAVLVVQPLLPLAFEAQRDELLTLARVFMLWIVPALGFESMASLLAGGHQFVALNVVRVAQPLVFAAGLGTLAVADAADVTNVLLANAASYLVVFVASAVYLIRTCGLGRPSREVARTGLSYGLRLQGTTIGMIGNNRLDVLVLPAIVAAPEIGLYVVAVSVASILVSLFGQLGYVVFPAASRADDADGLRLVERASRVVLLAAAVGALAMAITAPLLVRIVYGADFVPSATSVRLLLPGIVLWSAALILSSGLRAVGRPTADSMAHLAGLVVTLVGLAALLPGLGIEGAAITSSLSYATVFVVTLLLLRQEPHFSVSRSLDVRRVPGDLRDALGRRARHVPEPAPHVAEVAA